jgi:hypothetical protein
MPSVQVDLVLSTVRREAAVPSGAELGDAVRVTAHRLS